MNEASGQLAFEGMWSPLYPDETKELQRKVAEEHARHEQSRRQKFQVILGETALNQTEANEEQSEDDTWTEQAI